MMRRTTSGARRLGAALGLAAAALALGAVFGQPDNGGAAADAAPGNTASPTITGTPQEGETVRVTPGTWSGSPTSYAYAWSRCDQNGDGCAAIAGATDDAYKLVAGDVGHTLRATVTATNADGSSSATSAPSAVVSSAAAPANTAAPAISGTVAVGQKLTASKGDWNNNPTTFAYAWSRCDENGNSCSAIGGATADTYTLKQVDAGTTLRVSVTASNGAGSTQATSVPTAVVPGSAAPAGNGCPAGTGTIQVHDLAPPARLSVSSWTMEPAVVRPSVGSIQLRARVTACDGRPVQGATVFAVSIPYNQFRGGQATTDGNGWATLTQPRLSGYPASRRQQLLAVLLRATKPGESALGGVSVRRVVSFPASTRG
ncbi:MAG TPA: hypothetical protein VFJ77_11625 [Gaiellaceae bacterium]|nr:hypothetical protein [Gaiellaceae bacterium]